QAVEQLRIVGPEVRQTVVVQAHSPAQPAIRVMALAQACQCTGTPHPLARGVQPQSHEQPRDGRRLPRAVAARPHRLFQAHPAPPLPRPTVIAPALSPRSPGPVARHTAALHAPPPATPLGRARAPEAVACPATPVPLVRSRANLQTVYRATSMPPALIRKESSATCFGNKNLAVLQRFTTSEERAQRASPARFARQKGAAEPPQQRGASPAASPSRRVLRTLLRMRRNERLQCGKPTSAPPGRSAPTCRYGRCLRG